jgi:hypothetical protein
MKALKTIVATAVIVFTLTTVAMAGVQHLNRRGDDATSAGQATHAAAQPTAEGGITLSTRQFAALLRAVHGGTQDRTAARTHDGAQARPHAHGQSHTPAASGSAGSGTTAGVTHHTAIHEAGTHHATTHHTTTHATSHDSGTHDGGTHDGGTHDSGGDGGCD